MCGQFVASRVQLDTNLIDFAHEETCLNEKHCFVYNVRFRESRLNKLVSEHLYYFGRSCSSVKPNRERNRDRARELGGEREPGRIRYKNCTNLAAATSGVIANGAKQWMVSV